MKALLVFSLLGSFGCNGAKMPNMQFEMGKETAAKLNETPKYDVPKSEAVGAQADAAPERKLIQTAKLEVAVEDMATAKPKVDSLLEQHHATIHSSEFSGDPGKNRRGNWLIKVEPGQFDKLVNALVALGRPKLHKTESQDVSEEYFDLASRVRNLKVEEETLNRLLKESVRTTTDMLEFRKNILQLRGDIEKAEGRLNVLGRLTALSTIHFSMTEEKAFVPAKVENEPKPPTYGEKVGTSAGRSYQELVLFFTDVSIVAVGLLIWSPVIVPLVLVAWVLLRWMRRHWARLNTPIMASPKWVQERKPASQEVYD